MRVDLIFIRGYKTSAMRVRKGLRWSGKTRLSCLSCWFWTTNFSLTCHQSWLALPVVIYHPWCKGFKMWTKSGTCWVVTRMARWRASLSSSVSRGEGGQAGDPMNCSEVKVKYLKVKVKYPKVMVTGQGQVPKDVIVLPSPDKVLHPLKFFPAGSRALPLPSPPALCPGPPCQGGDDSTEQKWFIFAYRKWSLWAQSM